MLEHLTTREVLAPTRARRLDRALVVSVAATLVLATVLPPRDLFGSRTFEIHILSLLPFAGVAYLVALLERRWLLVAPAGALMVAEITSGISATLFGVPWLLSIGSVVIGVVSWAPWPPVRARTAADRLLILMGVLPVATVGIALALGRTELPSLFGERLSAMTVWNELAYSALVGLAAALIVRSRIDAATPERHGGPLLPPWGLHVLVLVNLIVLALTGSRAAGVMGLAALAWIALQAVRTKAGRTLGYLTVEMTVFSFIFVPRLITRSVGGAGTEAIAGVTTTGRVFLWEAYLEEGREFLLTGGGLGRTHRISLGHPGIEDGVTPHNEYLRFLINVGVVGTILVALAWGVVIWHRTRNLRSGSPVGPLLLLLPVLALIDNAITALSLIIPLMIVASLDADDAALDGADHTGRRSRHSGIGGS